MDKIKVGCIGIGVMGSALMQAIARVIGPSQLVVSDPDSTKRDSFCTLTGCLSENSNAKVVAMAEYVFLAVKPQYLEAVLSECIPSLSEKTILVSMAAGVSIERLQKLSGGHSRVVRIMPNTPASVSSGVVAIAPDSSVTTAETEELCRLLSGSGLTEITPENLMDAVTAISGSGPAYGYIFIEALSDAAVQMGMPRAQALRYAAATLRGAGEMVLKTGIHPAVLKDGVCSPGGTTIAAVTSLEEKGFRAAIIAAARQAWLRSKELSSI
ncbi:MAG TPA: pyrroline-5-carboxylate reductase [Treponemataceae bacterium]|nr:pyrroline-5-carboxylate reductase [Treponemataceae bacterium]